MKYRDPHGNQMPKGVFFDTERKRYRVRIYRHGRPVWCSYHYDYHEAMVAYHKAHSTKDEVMAQEGEVVGPERYADALRRNLV